MSELSEALLKDAALVVDVCMSVEKDDVVTIICDDDHRPQADALARVAEEVGAEAHQVALEAEAGVHPVVLVSG